MVGNQRAAPPRVLINLFCFNNSLHLEHMCHLYCIFEAESLFVASLKALYTTWYYQICFQAHLNMNIRKRKIMETICLSLTRKPECKVKEGLLYFRRWNELVVSTEEAFSLTHKVVTPVLRGWCWHAWPRKTMVGVHWTVNSCIVFTSAFACSVFLWLWAHLVFL